LALALVLFSASGRQQLTSGPTIMKSRHFYPQMKFCPPPGASVCSPASLAEWADVAYWDIICKNNGQVICLLRSDCSCVSTGYVARGRTGKMEKT